MKKILLITESLGSGGAERQLTGLAVSLNQREFDVKVVTYCHNQFYEPCLRDNHVKYDLIPDLQNRWLRPLRLVRLFRSEKPDVIISFLPFVNMACCLAKPLVRAKLIVSERNNNVTLTIRDRVNFLLYRLADCIVPNSYSQGDFISKNFPSLSGKVFPIVNYVDTSLFVPKANYEHKDFVRVVTVARLLRHKNCLLYLEAVRKIKEQGLNARFDWYGGHNPADDYYDRVCEAIDRLGIGDCFTLHDASDRIVEVYHSSDVLCLPSLHEGYPNVVCEAMSCGLPVICSNLHENPRIVEEGINGFLFNPAEVSEMADALTKVILMSDSEREQMGRVNREKVMRNNTIEHFVKQYIDLL